MTHKASNTSHIQPQCYHMTNKFRRKESICVKMLASQLTFCNDKKEPSRFRNRNHFKGVRCKMCKIWPEFKCSSRNVGGNVSPVEPEQYF